jgi:hypothetical protein
MEDRGRQAEGKGSFLTDFYSDDQTIRFNLNGPEIRRPICDPLMNIPAQFPS